MKNFLFCLFILFVVSGCDSAKSGKPADNNAAAERSEDMETRKVGYYGKKIDEDGAITGRELKEKLGNNTTMDAKVKGEVVEVCQSEGCWLQMDMEDGTTMQVKMKEHNFTVPKDISGRLVIAEGTVLRDTVSVEELRHYAEDLGKSEDEINAIIQPEPKLTFTADGVIIK